MPGLLVGYSMAAVAVLFFGSNFVVTKSFPTGDGIAFNFFLAASIFLTGLLYQIGICTFGGDAGAQSVCPTFEPFAMLGALRARTGALRRARRVCEGGRSGG